MKDKTLYPQSALNELENLLIIANQNEHIMLAYFIEMVIAEATGKNEEYELSERPQ